MELAIKRNMKLKLVAVLLSLVFLTGVVGCSASDPITDPVYITNLNAPTGRTATYVIAASDAPAHVKAQADIVATGVSDETIFNAACAAYTDVMFYGTLTGDAPFIITHAGGVNLSVRGNGFTSQLTLANGSNCDVLQVGTLGNSVAHVLLSNFKVEGNKANQASGNGILHTDVNGTVDIDRLYVSNIKQDGLYGTFNQVSNLFIRGAAGIGYRSIAGLMGNNIVIEISGSYGFYATTTEEIHINNLWTVNGSSDGVRIVSSGVTSLSNILSQDNLGYGIKLISVSNVHINGGSIRRNNEAGLLIDSSQGCSISGINFYNNSVSPTGGNPLTNLWILGGGGHQIIGNSFANSGHTDWSTVITADPAWGANSIIGNWTEGEQIAINSGINIIKDNGGYIAPSELRTASGTLTGGAANAILFAWHNPELQDIFIKKVVITITTADADAANIDVGIADDATYTNGGTEFFDDLPGETIAVDDSWLASDGGKQTKWVLCQDSASTTDGWVVAKILTNDGTSIVGSYYIEYVGK
jgi:hypothetical protein